jgi:hypothetical protein
MTWSKAIVAGLLAGIGFALAERLVEKVWPAK